MPEHVNVTVGYLARDVDLNTATTRRTTLQDPKTLDMSYASDVTELMAHAIEALGLGDGGRATDIATKECGDMQHKSPALSPNTRFPDFPCL